MVDGVLSPTGAGAVLQELPVSSAAAVDPSVRRGQTQVLAAAVVGSTWRKLTWRASQTHQLHVITSFSVFM